MTNDNGVTERGEVAQGCVGMRWHVKLPELERIFASVVRATSALNPNEGSEDLTRPFRRSLAPRIHLILHRTKQ